MQLYRKISVKVKGVRKDNIFSAALVYYSMSKT